MPPATPTSPEPKEVKRLEPEEMEKEVAPAPAAWPAGCELDASPSGRKVFLSTWKRGGEESEKKIRENIERRKGK